MSSCDLIFKLEQETDKLKTVFNLSVSCSNLNIKSQDDIFRSVFYPLLFQIFLWLRSLRLLFTLFDCFSNNHKIPKYYLQRLGKPICNTSKPFVKTDGNTHERISLSQLTVIITNSVQNCNELIKTRPVLGIAV